MKLVDGWPVDDPQEKSADEIAWYSIRENEGDQNGVQQKKVEDAPQKEVKRRGRPKRK